MSNLSGNKISTSDEHDMVISCDLVQHAQQLTILLNAVDCWPNVREMAHAGFLIFS